MSIEPAGGIRPSAATASAATAGDTAGSDAASAVAELAEIQRLAHVGSWHHDLGTGARRWSAELLRIYGFPADADPPTRDEQGALMDPTEFAEMVALLDRASTNGETGEVEYWVTRSDGTTRRVVGRVEAVRDATGAITALRGTGADVTELVATRTALSRSEARYRLLAENASDVVMSMKPDGTIDWVSPSVTDILGWRPRDLVGRQALDLAHPDDHPVVFATREAALTSRHGRFEVRVLAEDGSWHWMALNARMIRAADGTITGRISAWRLIDDAVAARQALEASEARYRLLAEHATDVVARVSNDGVVEWISASLTDHVGWLPNQIIGHRVAEFVHPDDVSLLSHTRAEMAEGVQRRIELRLRSADGTWKQVAVAGRPIRGDSGAVVGRVSSWRNIDGEVAARNALAASEARYRLLAENAGDVVASVDNEGIIDWISPSVSDVLGWTPQELVGTPALELSHPGSRRAVVAARRPSLAGEPTRFEGQIRTRSGAYRWVEVSTRPIADAAGKVTGRVSTWRDIEAEVAAREQVLEGKRLLEAVFESTSDAVFAKDADGRYIVCNRVTAAFVGRTAAEMIGLTDADLFPAGDAAAIRKDDLRIMAGGEPETVDEEITFADGRTHWTMATKAPLRDTSGAVIGIVGVIRDVTERREAEARYRSTLDRMLEGCMLIDRTWRYLYLNDVAAAHGHTTRAATLGTTMLEAYPGIEQTEVFARFRRCMDTREPQRFEAPYSFDDGSTDWFSFSVEPVPEGIFVLSVDITEQRQTTEALRDSEARLAEALRLEAIGRLAGGVAHDFNNLLMAINGTAELLAAETPEDDPRRADVDAISEAGRRAAALTSQLLAFGRRQVLRPTVVSLDEVLAEATPLLRRTLGEDIELRVEAARDATPVRVDRSQLEQVIVNLVFNARDAMPDGGALTLAITPTIADEATASRLHGVHPGRFIRLSVSDTGIGIPTDIADRIFEPFFTTKGLGRGTGLGLATVQGIVAQSGGWIEMDSQPGHGTTFQVHLPVAVEPVAPVVEAPAITVMGGSELILLVEDEEQVRHVAVRMLRDLGYAVMEFSGPYPALALDTGTLGAVDLLVTDVVMPGLNGLRLDSLLRERAPKLRTIFMSGFAPDAAVRERLQVPGTAFIEKPFSRADLARSVRMLLDAGPQDSSASPS
jgi:PAS domain S-box-containing protein